MRERNLIRDVAWALFAGEDATYVAGQYEPSPDELALTETLIGSLLTRGLRLLYVDQSPAALEGISVRITNRTDGRIPPLDFKVEGAADPIQAYRSADEIASGYFGDQRFVLHAKSATVGEGTASRLRFDVEFTATPIGGPDA
jgi:hypothetical protein